MRLSKLLKAISIEWKKGRLDREIKGIAYDSRLVRAQYLFVAVRGFTLDGHDYIRDAVNRGAAVVVAEHPGTGTEQRSPEAGGETAFVCVSDSREALARLSAAFYGQPSRQLSLIGITGTNGKTTTSFITRNIIEAGGSRSGLLGTIYYVTGGRLRSALNTTPESLDLQRYLREMADSGFAYAVLEVSSHALALKRVEGCSFKVGAFTNFSQDHLDFHGTMDEYFKAKTRLFDYVDDQGTAVLNSDDPKISTLPDNLDCRVVTCGIESKAMITAENISEYRREREASGPDACCGLSFTVKTPGGSFALESPLIGRFNVCNILMAVGIASSLGIKEEVIQQGVSTAGAVEGRFEQVYEGQNFLCIVDYAHTEDALRKLIQEARRITEGKITTVFGCGGDRDRKKRPLMGAAAAELSDSVIVTSDNPRSEDPLKIIKDILKGIKRKNCRVEPDREKAIAEAVSLAGPGDTLLVAGKGHETYQEIQGVRHHFSDKEILKKEIKKRSALSG